MLCGNGWGPSRTVVNLRAGVQGYVSDERVTQQPEVRRSLVGRFTTAGRQLLEDASLIFFFLRLYFSCFPVSLQQGFCFLSINTRLENRDNFLELLINARVVFILASAQLCCCCCQRGYSHLRWRNRSRVMAKPARHPLTDPCETTMLGESAG